jgi:SAM-dependent methyltransferase
MASATFASTSSSSAWESWSALRTPSEFERAYLGTDDERAQSGFNGSAERWEAARRGIVEGIDRPGTFLDVGCANGLLMESVAAWSSQAVEVYGIDFALGLVELAQARCGAERVWLADAVDWHPPFRFDFAHIRLEYFEPGMTRFARRTIVSSDGSFRRPDSAKAEPVAERLRELGLEPAGEWCHHDHEHLVELAVAWVDKG